MLLKIYEVMRTDKLRDILLFESDLNFSNEIFFLNTLMKIAESSGVLPHEQHGDRSGHMLIEVAVLKIIFFDYII